MAANASDLVTVEQAKAMYDNLKTKGTYTTNLITNVTRSGNNLVVTYYNPSTKVTTSNSIPLV